MDDALLNNFLTETLSFLKEAKEQVPMVAQEVLNYYKITSSLYVTGSTVLILASAYAVKKLTVRNKYGHIESDNEGYLVIIGIANLINLPFFICNVYTLVQLYAAPRIFLIEYVANLLKH